MMIDAVMVMKSFSTKASWTKTAPNIAATEMSSAFFVPGFVSVAPCTVRDVCELAEPAFAAGNIDCFMTVAGTELELCGGQIVPHRSLCESSPLCDC